MRRLVAALMVSLLVLSGSPPGWSCVQVVLPPDPCADASIFGSEFLADLPNQEPFESEDVIVVEEGELEEEEPESEPDCGEIQRRLQDPDLGQRLLALDEMIDGTLSVEGCSEVGDTLAAMMRAEKDAFLVFRAVEPLSHLLEDPAGLLDFFDHPSVDVRRKTAEVLRGEVFEAEQAACIATALQKESDPAVQIALASLRARGTELEAGAALARIVEGGGPLAPVALFSLASLADSPEPVIQALERKGALRSAAIQWLGDQAADPRAREALVGVVRDGTTEEQLHAAARLTGDPSAGEAAVWQSVVLDRAIPLRWRAALVFHASMERAWRPAACEAKHADPELSRTIDSFLTDPEAGRRLEAITIPWLESVDLLRVPAGVLRPQARASVRCASRPSGPPRPGAARIPAGNYVVGIERFTSEDEVWLGLMTQPVCWVPETVVDPATHALPPEGALEADVPVEVLDALPVAIDAGDLELFDPVEGFTGVRLRDASPDLQARWRSGQDGVLRVLAAVEANARLRESLIGSPQNR